MKRIFTVFKFIIIFFCSAHVASAQNNFWKDVVESTNGLKHDSQISLPKKYRTLRLDTAGLLAVLKTAPKEFTDAARNKPLIMTMPMPGGAFQRFKVVEAPIMEPGLAAKFTNIKTYGGQGIDDPHATIKLDWTEFGLHVMVYSQINGSVIIDPYSPESLVDYLSYNKKDIAASKSTFIEDEIKNSKEQIIRKANSSRTSAAPCISGTLRKYRLAIACTGQYAVAVGGANVTTAQAMSAITTTVNRVNGVYETEVDIRLVLVNNNNLVVFTKPTAQPFKGNNDARILINESQQVIDSLIGTANYDVGHTFSTGAGGYAVEGVVCNNTLKANGVTGSSRPYGDAYNIDFVSHEIGHQFGASHTFNATTGNCGSSNGNLNTNAEPGSGVTIMGYAGICQATNNLLANSIPYFHSISFDQITNYTSNGLGNTCAVQIATGNKSPIVDAGKDYVIPKSTPFVLSGSASDADGDPLTYSWEQVNVGSPFGNWNEPVEDAPIFRSFSPVSTPVRYFPQLTDIINNTTTIGEILPSYGRNLNFRLTVRDNRAGGGGVCSDESYIKVDSSSGPFVVTEPNTATTWDVGNFTTVKWSVANTNVAPVNCKNVNIELSVDGGPTFPITLVSNTPNDGIEEITIPNNVTTEARIRVVSVGNVFFDMSNVNFTIKGTTEFAFTFSNPLPVAACSNVAGTVINTNSLNKFSTPIALSASGNPVGTTVVFSSNPINPGSNDSITLSGNIPKGIYNITITGTAGSVVKTRVIQFIIGSPTKIVVNSTPANNSTSTILMPTFKWLPTTDAEFYTLQIATTPGFTTPVQSITGISASTYTLTSSLESNTEYYWRVISNNSCGIGPASSVTLFKTFAIACGDSVFSSNVPLTISVNKDTITSNLNIASGGMIQDIDVVGLKGKHSYISDLSFSLTSPSGRRILLINKQCGSNSNFDLNLDDEAPTSISCPFNDGQTSKPVQALSAFDNENSTGTWKLQIIDAVDEDGGSLTNWGLRICTYKESALPVTWQNFSGFKNASSVTLQWVTTNELNNDYFVVESSMDGMSFNNIGKIAAISSTGIQQYLFNDLRPSSGDNYYRLKQVDKDGNYTYSRVIKISFEIATSGFIVYPNPAISRSTVRILHDAKNITIGLRDALGKLLFKKVAGSVKAGEEFDIPVKHLAKGTYIVILTSEKGTSNEKLIVQ